jgi:hypothetical protein
MKMPFIISMIATSILMVGVYLVDFAYCFDDEQTHRKLTDIAVRNSDLNDYLKNILGVPEGIEGNLNGNSMVKWLQTGSRDEDHPPCRASNHFHNPLLPWDQSYNTDAPEYISFWCHDVPPTWPLFSNITWATGLTSISQTTPGSRDRQVMGWDNARTYFYQALTSDKNADRENNFIKTFSAVGQVMHLIQDMAVPAYVRKDFQSQDTRTALVIPILNLSKRHNNDKGAIS